MVIKSNNLKISNSIFTHNRCYTCYGNLKITHSNFTLFNLDMQYNQAKKGGALSLFTSFRTAVIDSCILNFNQAIATGGALYSEAVNYTMLNT